MEPFHPDMRFIIILTIGLFMKNLLSILIFLATLTACTHFTTDKSKDPLESEAVSVSPTSILHIDRRRALYDSNLRTVVEIFDESTSSLIIHTLYNCSLPASENEFFPILCLDLIHTVGEGTPTDYVWVISVILEKQNPLTHIEISSPALENSLTVRPPTIPVKSIGNNLGVLHQLYFSTDEEFITSLLLLNPVSLSIHHNDRLILVRDIQPEAKQLWFDFMKKVKENYNNQTQAL